MGPGWGALNRRGVLWSGLALAGSGWRGAAQTEAAKTSNATAPLNLGAFGREQAATLMPATVFFAGKVAPVQARNTGGAKMPGGVLIAGLVDTSGYSTGVQEKYQAYLLLDTAVRFSGQVQGPGAYGCGIVNGEFVLLNLGAQAVWSNPAPRDGVLKRPTPLQVLPAPQAGQFRLYFGRNYTLFDAVFAPVAKGATQ